MDSDDETSPQAVPFQLQFDKPLPSQIKIAEWNPEKDLLAMVTEDSKIVLHRFNWQRLWTISPGKSITSICWRPDGKAIALGLEDGTITLHDVENGKLLRSLRSHTAAVVCLNWEEDAQLEKDDSGDTMPFEDRTSRFFPPPPRMPRMPGLVPGDSGFIDDSQDSFLELSNSSHQRFNILCSGDRDGSLCFSIFGIFPIGKINIHSLSIPRALGDEKIMCQLLNASIHKVALSKNLCHLIVACSGELVDRAESTAHQTTGTGVHGLHHLVLNTSIFQKRKNELHQVALQSSNIEDLNEVVRESLSIIYKQWSDAMSTFREKFDSLSNLIIDHGIDSSPQEEFLSLLGGARTSPAVHQFLVNSLNEAGVKRVSKVVCGAGKELQLIVLNHLQPATEIITFRMGELRGLSKWHARFQSIGLDEMLVESAAEEAGMLLVQVERFLRVLSTVVQQFGNFFNWLLKCIKLLMSEPSDQLLTYNSELVIVFLKFLYDQDPVKQLLEVSEVDSGIEIDLETSQRVRELTQFGGFLDTEYLRRNLAKEFHQMEFCFKEAVQMPFSTISKKILCKDLMPLFPIMLASGSMPRHMPLSISFYEDLSGSRSCSHPFEKRFIDYISFEVPDGSLLGIGNCIAIVRGCMDGVSSLTEGQHALEGILLCMPCGCQCIDLSLYKESQIVLLLNETNHASESSGEAFIMILEISNLPFVCISRSTQLNTWDLHQLKDSVVPVQIKHERARSIPYAVIAPMAVSASRGVACVFAARKRALVYILEEDEDEVSDAE